MNLPSEFILNNTTYQTETLSKEAQDLLASLIMTDGHIQRLNQELAIAQTAKNGYQSALSNLIVKKK